MDFDLSSDDISLEKQILLCDSCLNNSFITLMSFLLCATASRSKLKVDHNYLASSYHNGIISGLMLISSYLERVSSAGGTVSYLLMLQSMHYLIACLFHLFPLISILRHFFFFFLKKIGESNCYWSWSRITSQVSS